MRYYGTLPEDQETTINILYDVEKLSIYSSNPKLIKSLSEKIGRPTKKFVKSKTYYSGASWEIDFSDKEKLNMIFSDTILIDTKVKRKPIVKPIKGVKKKDKGSEDDFYQISLL